MEGYGQTEVSQSMFAFPFVSLTREVIAMTGYAVCMCVRKKGLKPQRNTNTSSTGLFHAFLASAVVPAG